MAVLALVSAIKWIDDRTMQRRAAKARETAQHSVTVEVD